MGLVIVFLRASFGGYDGLADPVGWALVVAGLVPLRSRIPSGGPALALAAIAGVFSVPVFFPAVQARLGPSADWGIGLPQNLFCLVLVTSLTALAGRAGEPVARRFGLLRTAYAVMLLGPAVVYGGRVDALVVPLAVLTVVANVSLVYLTFRVARRPYALVEGDADRKPGLSRRRRPG